MDREIAPDYPYQTKVDMYDNKCSGCQFTRIEVYPSDVIYNIKPVVFNDVQKAIAYARLHGFRINRTCEYPYDINFHNDKPIYPTLTEIVSNTCEFWDAEKMSYFTQEDNNSVNIVELIEQIPNAEKKQ